jgi:EAL domain-containing protein (putative c-di-GMP-specific phosphodiesterase class I)/GGDEF domain-containing protein
MKLEGQMIKAGKSAIIYTRTCFRTWQATALLLMGLAVMAVIAAYVSGQAWVMVVTTLATPILSLALYAPPPPALDTRSNAPELRTRLAQGGLHNHYLFVLTVGDLAKLQDRLGPDGAEDALRMLLHRVRQIIRRSDPISRLDVTQFALLVSMKDSDDLNTALAVARRILVQAGTNIPIRGQNITLSCTIGLVLPRDLTQLQTDDAIQAGRLAALAAAKQGPGITRIFSNDMRRHQTQRQDNVHHFETALKNGEFSAWFQPQIRISDGQITGAEVLARWYPPSGTPIPPSSFLPTAEMTGRMIDLGQAIRKHAFHSFVLIKKQPKFSGQIAVNLSSEELAYPNLTDLIAWELDEANIPPTCLTVEVLETVLARSGEEIAARNLHGLRELGCRIDLDDFGTGNASITTLRHFPIERIKIDRSFIQHIDTSKQQAAMLRAILTMAKELHLDSLAEGIETQAEFDTLQSMGCQYGQGYFIARPMPASDFITWLGTHPSKNSPPSDHFGKTA